MASRTLRRSSSRVSPCVAQPGMAGTAAQKPPSSASPLMAEAKRIKQSSGADASRGGFVLHGIALIPAQAGTQSGSPLSRGRADGGSRFNLIGFRPGRAEPLPSGAWLGIPQERKSMIAHYRGVAGREASVAHGTFGIHARLFGRRHGDLGRIADVIRCVLLFSRPVDNPATNHSDGGRAERTQANNNADIQNRPLGIPRRPWRSAGRGCCENEDRCRCPPKRKYGECNVARAIWASAGSASPREELGIPTRAER